MGWEIYSGRGGNQHRRFVPDKDLPPEAQSVLAEPDWEAKYRAAEAAVAAMRERLESMEAVLKLAHGAVNDAFGQASAEYQGHDNLASKYDEKIQVFKARVRDALAKGPSQ